MSPVQWVALGTRALALHRQDASMKLPVTHAMKADRNSLCCFRCHVNPSFKQTTNFPFVDISHIIMKMSHIRAYSGTDLCM
jgi:hypothetical protein